MLSRGREGAENARTKAIPQWSLAPRREGLVLACFIAPTAQAQQSQGTPSDQETTKGAEAGGGEEISDCHLEKCRLII